MGTPKQYSLVQDRLSQTQKVFPIPWRLFFSLFVCFCSIYLFALGFFVCAFGGRGSGGASCLFAFILKDFRICFFPRALKLKEFKKQPASFILLAIVLGLFFCRVEFSTVQINLTCVLDRAFSKVS